MSFKEAAIEILKRTGQQLHYREIFKRAEKEGLIDSRGLTPWATMGAVISSDIQKNGNQSPFYKSHEPGFYGYKKPGDYVLVAKTGYFIKKKKKIYQLKEQLQSKISPRRKGDIAENRVAELINLYGKEGLSCYKPTTDDECIDFIVKSNSSNKTIFIQVKSNFRYGNQDRLVVTIDKDKLPPKSKSLIVFVYFDLIEGDIHDFIFCVPVDEFIILTELSGKKRKGVFSVSMKQPEKSRKFSQFIIEKRELARTIANYIKIMPSKKSK